MYKVMSYGLVFSRHETLEDAERQTAINIVLDFTPDDNPTQSND